MHARSPSPASRLRTLWALTLALLTAACGNGQTPGEGDPLDPGLDPNRTVGLFLNTPAAAPGYTLFNANASPRTYLIDNAGHEVHRWTSTYNPGNSVYLLDDGSVLRTGRVGAGVNARFTAGGAGGQIQRIAWDGTLLWDYRYSGPAHLHHHDIAPLPNGNVLILAWEGKTDAEAIQAGRDPARLPKMELWPDAIVEVQPQLPTGGLIVWQWTAWDHLVQDHDVTKDNFGVVADHPELIDVNFGLNDNADWMHSNGIHYNAALDQILLCVHHFGEIWVIDHSTTTAEAAGHAGGTQGKGGDILYRWGNPAAYAHGTDGDQKLFGQHDARWLGDGNVNILVFNNGAGRPAGDFSSIEEIVPPANAMGAYTRTPATPFGPPTATWTYTAPVPTDFYASFISGAMRPANGNTLICDGPRGRFIEIMPGGDVVWDYVNPDVGSGPIEFDQPIPTGPTGTRRNATFRCTRIAPGHPGLVGKDLTPGDVIEQ